MVMSSSASSKSLPQGQRRRQSLVILMISACYWYCGSTTSSYYLSWIMVQMSCPGHGRYCGLTKCRHSHRNKKKKKFLLRANQPISKSRVQCTNSELQVTVSSAYACNGCSNGCRPCQICMPCSRTDQQGCDNSHRPHPNPVLNLKSRLGIWTYCIWSEYNVGLCSTSYLAVWLRFRTLTSESGSRSMHNAHLKLAFDEGWEMWGNGVMHVSVRDGGLLRTSPPGW